MDEINMIDAFDDMMFGGIVQQCQPYKVLVRVDSAGRITSINSDAFLDNVEGWIEIDSGYSDKYHHAQGNYLPLPIMDERGIYRYKLVDGEVVERTQEEMDADWIPPEEKPTPEQRIEELEAALIELASIIGGAE